MVFVTNTGKKFHTEGCRYLAKSKVPISSADAQARGYTPCSVCSEGAALVTAPVATAPTLQPPARAPTTEALTAEALPAPEAASVPPPDAGSLDATVYVTNSGEKYHTAGCRYLSKSQNPITLSKALALGYTACSVCGGGAYVETTSSDPNDSSVSGVKGKSLKLGPNPAVSAYVQEQARNARIAPRPSAGIGYSAPPEAYQAPPGAGVAENGSYYGQISENTGRPKTVEVKGYYRKDGTYVRGHYRSAPSR